MSLEAVLVALIFAAVLGFVMRLIHQRRRFALIVLMVLFSVSSAWMAMSWRTVPLTEEEIPYRPIAVPDDGFVSSQTCRSCHPHEYGTWHDSYHRRMTQLASPETVLGDFDDVRLELHGKTYRLGHDDELFWVDLELSGSVASGSGASGSGEDGQQKTSRRPILVTTGSHHIQAYWYPTGNRRKLALFPWVYLVAEDRWMPRESVFIRPPNSEQPDETKAWADDERWNHTCIHCHTTNGQPMFENLDTRVAEFGIACESCHGPGEEHIRLNMDPRRRYQMHLGDGDDDTMVDPKRLVHRRSSQVCGMCHGISYPKAAEVENDLGTGRSFRPGDDIADTRIIVQASLGAESLRGLPEYDPAVRVQSFWKDGMVRVKGREYNGLIDSPCYQRGELSCFSCHVMHQSEDDPRPRHEWADDQLKPGMDGGGPACLQCHEEFGAAKTLEAHTRHKPESSGSDCYNCHMPYTTFGLIKGIRSHRIDSPSVAASLETGRPNACNQCHLDKTLAWSADYLEQWYQTPQPAMNEVEKAVPASLYWLLTGDAAQRGLMAWNMRWEAAREISGTHWMTPFLGQLLLDPYDGVRLTAALSLRHQPGFEDFGYDDVVGSSEADRRAAAQRAGEIWSRLEPPEGQAADARALIVDPQGIVPQDVFSRLLRLRNDRMVALAE